MLDKYMNVSKLIFIAFSLLSVSCSNVHKDGQQQQPERLKQNKADSVNLLQQDILLIEYSRVTDLLDMLQDEAMQRDGRSKLAALQRENNSTQNIPLTSVVLLFETLIKDYPLHRSDHLLYRLSREYEKSDGRDEALKALNQLLGQYPKTQYYDKAQFWRGEILFSKRRFAQAQAAYGEVVAYRKYNNTSGYYEKAVYKQGWSHFKLSHYNRALNLFMHLLDLHADKGYMNLKLMPSSEREFIEGVMNVINLSFSYQAGPISARDYFADKQKRIYEYQIFASLARFYLNKKKYADSVRSYRLFVSANKVHLESPGFLLAIINIYDEGGFSELVLQTKKDYVQRYNINSNYWGLYKPAETRKELLALKENLQQLATHYYTQALQSKTSLNYRQANRWYQLWLYSFPNDLNSLQLRQLKNVSAEVALLASDEFDTLWQAAELSERENNMPGAEKIYADIINRFPLSLERSIEAQQRLLELYAREENKLQAVQWRVQLVNADARGGEQRTERTRYLAARSRFALAEPVLDSYRKVKLSLPLKKSLEKKRKRMHRAIKAYRRAASYKQAEMLAASTYRIAEIYRDFAQAIYNSEKPENLTATEQKEYTALLQKKAAPFEEKAIEFHEINVSRFADGLNEVWLWKSLERLKEFLPERYNRKERSDDTVDIEIIDLKEHL